MTWPFNIQSNTPPPYRFKLVNPDNGKTLILRSYPLGWKNGMLEFNRRIEVGGVFANFATDSLTFFKEGAKFLRDIWEAKELNGKCDLHVYYWKFTTQAYVEFPNSFALNFSDCQPRVKIGKNSIGFGIKTQNNSTLTLLDNRKKTNVDITKLTSLGGYPIIDYGNSDSPDCILPELRKEINVGAINKVNSAGWNEYSGIVSFINGLNSQNTYTTVPLNVIYSDFSESTAIGYSTRAVNISSLTPIMRNVAGAMNLRVFITISVDVFEKYRQDYWSVKFIATDNIYTITSEVTMCIFGKHKGIQFFVNGDNISIPANGNLYFLVEVGKKSDVKAVMLGNPSIAIFQTVANVEATIVEGYPLYESFERVLQHNLDVQFPFYSNFLGRTDVVYDLANLVYATENQLRFFSIVSGLGWRGMPIKDNNNPYSLNFESLFHSVSSMLNL
jgi:hypothetical protein